MEMLYEVRDDQLMIALVTLIEIIVGVGVVRILPLVPSLKGFIDEMRSWKGESDVKGYDTVRVHERILGHLNRFGHRQILFEQQVLRELEGIREDIALDRNGVVPVSREKVESQSGLIATTYNPQETNGGAIG